MFALVTKLHRHRVQATSEASKASETWLLGEGTVLAAWPFLRRRSQRTWLHVHNVILTPTFNSGIASGQDQQLWA